MKQGCGRFLGQPKWQVRENVRTHILLIRKKIFEVIFPISFGVFRVDTVYSEVYSVGNHIVGHYSGIFPYQLAGAVFTIKNYSAVTSGRRKVK